MVRAGGGAIGLDFVMGALLERADRRSTHVILFEASGASRIHLYQVVLHPAGAVHEMETPQRYRRAPSSSYRDKFAWQVRDEQSVRRRRRALNGCIELTDPHRRRC